MYWPAGSVSTTPPSLALSARADPCRLLGAVGSSQGCLGTFAGFVDTSAGQGTGIVDGTEARVRKPAENNPNQDRFSSGKTKQSAVKTTVVTKAEGYMLFCAMLADASDPRVRDRGRWVGCDIATSKVQEAPAGGMDVL